MRIAFSPIQDTYFNNKENFKPRCSSLSPLCCDTVSFGAMKKREFKGADLFVVNTFKAPIEKFNSNEDFQNWCGQKIDEIKTREYTGRNEGIKEERERLLQEWSNAIVKNNHTNAEALIILESITRDLKKDNDNTPPVLSKSILSKVMDKINHTCSTGGLNFKKIYTEQMSKEYLDGTNTGWVIIKGKKSDPENFDENVNRLKALSYKTWCTTGKKAQNHLEQGDVHLYVEDGKTKLSIALKDNEIAEIQGELNNWIIPFEYIDTANSHIKECGLKLSKRAKSELEDTQKAKIELEKSRIILKNAIKNNDVKTILEYFGIEVEKNDDGLFEISEYKQPEYFTFSDLGADENELLSKVAKINGNAKFYGSKATTLGGVRYIGGDADLKYSNIKTLNNLNTVGGSLDLRFSSVKDSGDLTVVAIDFYNGACPLTHLKNLKDIGRNADFRGGKIIDYGNLGHIGLNAFIPKETPEKDVEFLTSIAEYGVYYY